MTLAEKTFTLAALALVFVASACGPAKPADPSFKDDVAAIFSAHCARCHSANGPDGGFSDDPGTRDAGVVGTGDVPRVCHLDFYEGDPATCGSVDGGALPLSCQGAHFCATMYKAFMSSYINGGGGKPMPPPPSSLMNDWERDVVERWIGNPKP